MGIRRNRRERRRGSEDVEGYSANGKNGWMRFISRMLHHDMLRTHVEIEPRNGRFAEQPMGWGDKLGGCFSRMRYSKPRTHGLPWRLVNPSAASTHAADVYGNIAHSEKRFPPCTAPSGQPFRLRLIATTPIKPSHPHWQSAIPQTVAPAPASNRYSLPSSPKSQQLRPPRWTGEAALRLLPPGIWTEDPVPSYELRNVTPVGTAPW